MQLRLRQRALGPNHHVLAVDERTDAAVAGRRQSGASAPARISTSGTCCRKLSPLPGFRPKFAKLLDQIGDRLFLAGGAGLAALEVIRGQHADVRRESTVSSMSVEGGGTLVTHRASGQQQACGRQNRPKTPEFA